MLRRLWKFLSGRESGEWTVRFEVRSKTLITGDEANGILATRVVRGTRQYRRATPEEELDYMDTDAW